MGTFFHISTYLLVLKLFRLNKKISCDEHITKQKKNAFVVQMHYIKEKTQHVVSYHL